MLSACVQCTMHKIKIKIYLNKLPNPEFHFKGTSSLISGPEASSEELERSKLELKLIQKERDELMKEKEQLAREKEHLTGNCEKYKNDLLKEAAFR